MCDSWRRDRYIGKALDLAKRVAQYFNPRKEDLKNQSLVPLIRRIDYILCESEREALLLERRLINENQPFFNVLWKDGKTYPYLKITLGEDFPRIFTTRRKAKDGGAYFGPFPKVTPIRALLRYLWKQRLFPLRPCRWDFSQAKPLDKRKITACLYYHTKEYPAPCAGKISKADYRDIAERAVLFFKGRYDDLRGEFEREMNAASKAMDYERAMQLRDNVSALSQMGERVRVRAVEADQVGGHTARTQMVTDLQGPSCSPRRRCTSSASTSPISRGTRPSPDGVLYRREGEPRPLPEVQIRDVAASTTSSPCARCRQALQAP